MKLRATIFIFAILFLGIQFCSAQEDFNINIPVSISPPWNCEFILQHVDLIIEELEKNPDSIAYIVIAPQRQKSKLLSMGGFWVEDIISQHLKSKKWWYSNQNRIRFIRGESEKIKIEFRIAPNDSVKPNLKPTNWDFTIPSKPVLFDENYGGQLCAETPFRLNAFAEILRTYPKARGHFVIYAASFKDFPKEKESIVNDINQIGMRLDQFKFFFKKDSSTIYPYAKLWLVPKE